MMLRLFKKSKLIEKATILLYIYKHHKEVKNYLKDNKIIKLEKGQYHLSNNGKEGYKIEKV